MDFNSMQYNNIPLFKAIMINLAYNLQKKNDIKNYNNKKRLK